MQENSDVLHHVWATNNIMALYAYNDRDSFLRYFSIKLWRVQFNLQRVKGENKNVKGTEATTSLLLALFTLC